MPQVLKDEVRWRIAKAALRVFAAEGYEGATVAAIADQAGTAAGNIYRYHDSKEALFDAVVPERLVRRFRDLLKERLRAAGGAGDVRDLPEGHPYLTASDALMDFAVEHRLELVIVLGGRGGARWEDVPEEVVEELVAAALEHVPVFGRRAAESRVLAFDLEQVYRNFVATLVAILERFEGAREIREATAAFERYHLGGLASLVEGVGQTGRGRA